MLTDAELNLSATSLAPSTARHRIAAMDMPTQREIPERVLLIVSELVTNAVQHAGASRLTVYASIGAGCVRIAVHDYGEPMPDSLQQIPDPTSPSGRGLLIVSALASRWGIVPDVPPPGKTVWAELDAGHMA